MVRLNRRILLSFASSGCRSALPFPGSAFINAIKLERTIEITH